MSLETIQTDIVALRSEVKTLTKLIRKIKNTQEDPDGETLRDLLAPPADVVVTYLNLQKYLSPHYIKKEKA